jgi:phage-related minor tail protein
MTQTSRLVLEIDSRDAEQKASDARKALEALESVGLRVKPAMDKVGSGLDGAGSSAVSATKTFSSQRAEIEQLLGRINPLTKQLGDLDKQEVELARHRKAGTIDLDTYTEYQQRISATRNDLTRFSDSLTRTGNTAKQTAAALRGVPAQFTDIAVSLQGGQAPLTVFLQQGGQLKDMFGGVAPAAKALGGYIAGLINPFTIAAAAVGTLTFAAYKGYEQAELYRKALTLTGNAAGKTSDDLIALSGALAGGRNFSEASEAVLALAGNGRLVGEAFTEVARASTELAVATGKSAADIADQLSSTKGKVADLAAEYSEKYGAITKAVFEQVRSLEEQGDRMGAVKVLAGALANEMAARNKEMIESTRGLSRAWDEVKSSMGGAWTELKAGLSASPEMFKLQHLQSQLQDAQQIGDAALISGLEKQVALAQQIVDSKTQATEKTSSELQERKALVSADQKWFELTKKEMSDQAKLAKDIADARKLGVEAGRSQAEIDKVVGDIQDKYDKKQAKPKAYREDAGMKALDAARQTQAVLLQQNASLNAQGIATEKVGTQAQTLIKWEQQLADIKGKKTLTADQKSLLASQDLITAQLKKNVALEREAQISRDIQQAQKDQVQLLTLTGQLREANSLKSSLDDAAQMAEYERQGNTEAMKRLETLIKIRDINLKASQKPGTIEGVSQAPQVTGIDASVGGAYSEIQRLNEESAKVDAWRTMELEKQKAYLDLKAINEETYAERVNNINQQGRDNQAKIERAKNSAVLTSSADFFGNMTALSQSGNKKLAAVGKAAAIAQATIQGYVAVQNALAVQPYPLGMALAVSAGVAAAANVAAIAGIGFSGGGYTGPGGVNEVAGTVHKGEVVWSQKDIQRYGGVAAVEALRNGNVSAIPAAPTAQGSGQMSSMSSSPPQIHITVNGDGSSGSANATAGYEQMGQAVLATVRSEMPKVARAVIQQEKGQNGLLDPSNRRNAA